ncbi:MAG: hypothetical protein K6C36_03000 [Clostridia bacterium]|nr:hypothetical protein [Clostridia bacterium]
MKKLLSVALIFVLLIAAASCGSKNEQGGDASVFEQTQPSNEKMMKILSRDGELLGQIDCRSTCTAVDGGIFYSIFELGENRYTVDAEYRFFDKESKRDVLLGTLEDQGYEAVYTRSESNGKIYTLAIVGNPMSDSPVELVLLEADPEAGSLKKYTVSENGFPYASMAVSNGKLLIMDHEMSDPKCDKLYEFDPAAETVKEVLTFSSDTDSLRGVSSAEDGFALLRLKINGGGENEMFLDQYDNDHVRVSEQSVNEALVKAAMEISGIMSRQDALNELGMHVSRFTVEEGRYLIYENFGMARLIVDLQTGESVLSKSDIYSFSIGSGEPYIYRMDFDPQEAEEPDITRIVDGDQVKLSFEPTDPCRLIKEVSHSHSGTWLVMTADGDSAQNSSFALYLWTES